MSENDDYDNWASSKANNQNITMTNGNNDSSSTFASTRVVPGIGLFAQMREPKKCISIVPMKGHENIRFICADISYQRKANVIFNEFGEFVDPLTMFDVTHYNNIMPYKIDIDVNTEIKKMITTEVINEIKNLVDGVQSITDSVSSNKRRKEEEE